MVVELAWVQQWWYEEDVDEICGIYMEILVIIQGYIMKQRRRGNGCVGEGARLWRHGLIHC